MPRTIHSAASDAYLDLVKQFPQAHLVSHGAIHGNNRCEYATIIYASRIATALQTTPVARSRANFMFRT